MNAKQMVVARNRRKLWSDIGRLAAEIIRGRPLTVVRALAVLILGNAAAGVAVAAMGRIVDGLMGAARGDRMVFWWLAAYIATQSAENLYWAFKNHATRGLIDYIDYRMQERVLARAAAAPLLQFEQKAFFEGLQRAASGLSDKLFNFVYVLTDTIQVSVVLLSVTVALAAVSPAVVGLLLVTGIPSILLKLRTANLTYHAERRHATGDRIRTRLREILTGREAAAEVRLFGSTSFLLRRLLELRAARARDVLGAQGRQSRADAVGGLISGAGFAAALTVVAYLIFGGHLSVGDYVSVAVGAGTFEGYLGALISVLGAAERDAQFLGDVFDFWETPAEGEVGCRTAGGSVPSRSPWDESVRSRSPWDESAKGPNRVKGMRIEAIGVTFAYPTSSRPVLEDISLSIEPGERIAIVGENGVGKSTLVRLLMGLYPPGDGVILLDGVPATESPLALRRRMATVFQDFMKYDLSLGENIGFGAIDRLDDERAIMHAAERAGIADLAVGLPHGLDTLLGREFGETDLSGGQWQRVALARAFVRDADLLVLDEPTASLDPKAELALFERFIDLVEGRTAMIISHRLGAARLADRIVVLRKGRIAEVGSHNELVRRNGEYARLFGAQAQWYR